MKQLQRGSTTALIQERGSLLLHCPEKNGKGHGLKSEDLLQEQGGTGTAQQISLCSPPTAQAGAVRGSETTALHPLHSQPPPPTPPGYYTTEEKLKPILLKNQDRK